MKGMNRQKVESYLDDLVLQIKLRPEGRADALKQYHQDIKALHSIGYDMKYNNRRYHQLMDEYFPKPDNHGGD